MVISCPCALVISIPLGYFAGIGLASKNGILIKGASFLESLKDVTTAVFDKTGTLTDARFEVRQVNPRDGLSREELLEMARTAEAHSHHPVADAIRRAAPSDTTGDCSQSEERAGCGVVAYCDGRIIAVGNERLMEQEGVHCTPPGGAGTRVYVAVDGEYSGSILISDAPRSEASATLSDLKNLEVARNMMLTGDAREAAEKVSDELGVDDFHAGLLPEEKLWEIERLQNAGEKVLFAGDGINDAPVITAADVGVAMGGLGSDAAIEAADVVIMEDRLERLPALLQIAGLTRGVVRQNVVLTLGLKATFLTLGVVGLTSMWGAVFADVGVALLAVLNSSRILAHRVTD